MDIATSRMLMYRAEVKQDFESTDNSTPDVLDLCVRKREETPSPDYGYHDVKYPDPPTSSICFSSPGSNAGSETSEMSCSEKYGATYPSGPDYPVIQKAKIPRPFKAYPKNPLTLAIDVSTAESMLGKDVSTDAYTQFRHRMLAQVQNQNQGTNAKMRRTTVPSNSAQASDPTYWEKRRKNNEAAKRSRDARRAKEDEIAIRCAFLEQENLKVKFENSALRNEVERLRALLYN